MKTMRYIFGLIACILSLSVFGQSDGIYSIPLKDMEGNGIDLNKYKGRKLVFVVLPASPQDTSISFGDISAFQDTNNGTLVVIGIPPVDVGGPAQDTNKLKELYRKNKNIIVAEPMRVKKGTGQSPLFGWLTNKDRNRHFDQDVEGTGCKYFVDETGDLYAVLGPRFRLTAPLMGRVLARPKANTRG